MQDVIRLRGLERLTVQDLQDVVDVITDYQEARSSLGLPDEPHVTTLKAKLKTVTREASE